jgi:tRNA A37 N6-isopentenylltransferase MiaA
LEKAVQQIKYESHRFVRQQYNWCKLEDKHIKWFNIEDTAAPTKIHALVEGFIAKNDN